MNSVVAACSLQGGHRGRSMSVSGTLTERRRLAPSKAPASKSLVWKLQGYRLHVADDRPLFCRPIHEGQQHSCQRRREESQVASVQNVPGSRAPILCRPPYVEAAAHARNVDRCSWWRESFVTRYEKRGSPPVCFDWLELTRADPVLYCRIVGSAGFLGSFVPTQAGCR
jgi:hypothetical protein